MTDRIKEPWGECTPFGQGETWPVRVDQFLEEGVSEDDVNRWVQTASILHSNGGALDVAVKDGRIVGVRGRGVDRVNKGRVDSKDLFVWQANNSEERLKKPLVRENGELIEASWDEAMGRVVERSKALLEEKGPPRFRLLHHGSALSGGVLHSGCDRQGWHRHAAHGRQHSPVHRHRGRGAQADLRHRRPARLLLRRGSRRHHLPLRPQRRRDAGGALDADAGSVRRAPAPEARRGRPPGPRRPP